MADFALTQEEADALIAMEKRCVEDKDWPFPLPGEKLIVDLESLDRRENFILDVNRGRIKLSQATYQNRARQAVVLLRLDIDGPPHTNPDGEEMPCPHLHTYRAGYGTKWATPMPSSFGPTSNLSVLLQQFATYCRIAELRIQMDLFS